MAELPTGTVTLLFSDIEGSTRLLERLGDRYVEVLAEHRRLLRAAFARFNGREVGTEGDAFFIAFDKASEAVAAAVKANLPALFFDPMTGSVYKEARGEPIIAEALELFTKCFWHFAGNMALGYGAWDGMILTGSITAALKPTPLPLPGRRRPPRRRARPRPPARAAQGEPRDRRGARPPRVGQGPVRPGRARPLRSRWWLVRLSRLQPRRPARAGSASAAAARAAGIRAQITISTAFGCPFEGEVSIDRVREIAQRMAAAAPHEIAVADTIGVAVPTQVGCDDVIVVLQARGRPVPVVRMVAVAVDQQQGRRVGVAPVEVVQRNLLRFVDAQDQLVAWRHAHCLPYGEGITFWPVVEVLRDAAGIAATDSPAQSLGKLRALLRPGHEGELITARLHGFDHLPDTPVVLLDFHSQATALGGELEWTAETAAWLSGMM